MQGFKEVNMDSDTAQTRIEQLNQSNFHSWKIRIFHVLTLKGLEDHVTDDPTSDPALLPQWKKRNQKAQAHIALTLSDEMLANVQDVQTTKEMWKAIINVFERHTLLSRLSARRKFYTAAMAENESVLQFSNRIRQLASTLKTMNVPVSDSEMAMALLNGLPDDYHSLISALDSIDSDGQELKWDHIKSRVLQEEQRIKTRHEKAQAKSEAPALFTKTVSSTSCANCHGRSSRSHRFCNHCKKEGHIESKCWIKFPHLNPRNRTAIFANHRGENPAVCLLGNYEESEIPKNSEDWFIDSACGMHMTFDKS